MLDLFFGLNARLGRLQYLLACLGLGVAMAVISFALVVSGNVHIPKGAAHLTWHMLGWPAMAAVALFAVATVMLQAMRIRDIGWDPVIVMAAWLAITFANVIIAAKLPGLAGFGAMVAGLVNLVMTGVLLFWPGDEHY
jgi:uncharacterized membrane protein YhaH (DUF805 family)